MAAPHLHGPLPVISRDGLTPSARPAKRQPRPVGLLLAPKETLTVSTAWLSVGFSGSFCQQGQGESFSNVGKFPACLPARGASRGGLHGSLILQADAHTSRYLLRPPLRTPGSCPPRPHQRPALGLCPPEEVPLAPELCLQRCSQQPLLPRPGHEVWAVGGPEGIVLSFAWLSFCKPIRVGQQTSHGVRQSTKSRFQEGGRPGQVGPRPPG